MDGRCRAHLRVADDRLPVAHTSGNSVLAKLSALSDHSPATADSGPVLLPSPPLLLVSLLSSSCLSVSVMIKSWS
ncbi:hypothetical protein L2E82_05011 [Cichorium intybus]|uniref:Uncharacterized protein n=1 Tax=Cichorium intybus TaxID=13427 RepID=A0ACB9H6Y9_CICIN|nr:hypothetical protein L2E82_05011 [Cichorium intybus]